MLYTNKINAVKKSSIALIGVALLASSTGMALQKPRALVSDPRIKVVAYEPNNVVSINGTTFVNTQIIFDDNESVVDVESGDPDAWTVNINKALPSVINLKPTIVGSNTDLEVTTLNADQQKQFYRFHLSSEASSKDHPIQPTYAVRFTYPEQERAKLVKQMSFVKEQRKNILNAKRDPKHYNWHYSFHGNHQIMPLHIFDDGQFTYMQLRPNQDIPAIFAVDNTKGEEAVINFRRVDNFIVVKQLSPQFTLRDGKNKVASIFNDKMIHQLKANRW